MYNSLGGSKSNSTAYKAILLGLSETALVYTILGVVSIIMFGDSMQTNVLLNISTN